MTEFDEIKCRKEFEVWAKDQYPQAWGNYEKSWISRDIIDGFWIGWFAASVAAHKRSGGHVRHFTLGEWKRLKRKLTTRID